MWKRSSIQNFGNNYYIKEKPTSVNVDMERMRVSRIRDDNEYYSPSVHPHRTSLNANSFVGMSQTTDYDDNSSKIGEWLAQEEASLDKISLNYQLNDSFHGIQQAQPPPHVGNNDNKFSNNSTSNNNRRNEEHVLQRKTGSPFPIVGNTELRPTSEIPSPFHSIFKFGVFNIIQSKCIDDAFYENNNLVISAPTGSGKTVLMELAIIRVLLNHGSDSKIIYMAPSKSLCGERVKDWDSKLKPFGIKCKEFTGDTHYALISAIRSTTIIVTTPEKWNSMTRRWIDNKQLMQLIRLFLIDEVHILNEKRGACLEACVSRMKTMESNLRYIAVSATVPNLQDVATWLKAKPISFTEEYRPIKLDRFVYGYPQPEGNMFLFDKKLNWKLLDMINNHSNDKPTLIFCATRKSTQETCSTISKLMEKKKVHSLREDKKVSYSNIKFKDKLLPELVNKGLAFHHAGLDLSDRSQVESMFSEREIRVIATTSTLAVGVNLPAHLVIIKSTQGYQNGSLTEYSDIDLLQMIGRAGRPGLDSSGCAVIMTTNNMERRYNALVSGTTNLESRLHENLIEHLASEICLGTITNIITAIKWLQSTFLYVRVNKNPSNYKLVGTAIGITSDTILREICVKNLKLLEENSLIEKTDDSIFKPTQYGQAMDRYYIKFQTMVRILQASNPNSIKDTLQLVCQCQEEMDMIRFNAGEKQFLNSLKGHTNIKIPIEKVSSIADKMFILVQCVLGDISLYNSGNSLLVMEASNVMSNISRITKCLIDCSVQDKNPVKLKFALELYQSLQAKLWSTSPYIAKQVQGIGPSHAKTLAQANLINIEQLRNCDPGRIEMILHRNPPFGIKLKKHIESFPHFILNIEQDSSTKQNSLNNLHEFITLHIKIGLANTHIQRGKYGKGLYAQFWIETSERDLADFRRILISKLHCNEQKFDVPIEVKVPNMTITCHLKSEDYVGVDVTKELKAIVDPRKFISLVGESNAQCNKEYKNTATEDMDDVGFDDDFEIDIDLDLLKAMTDDSVTSSNKSCPSSLPDNEIQEYLHLAPPKSKDILSADITFDIKKSTKKKKKDLGELCKHRCKNKKTCTHACCKLHMINSLINSCQPTSGIKRASSVEDEENDCVTGKTKQKKLKFSGEERNTRSISHNVNSAKNSQQSVKASDETNSTDHLIVRDHKNNDNDTLMEICKFNDTGLFDCIENMSYLETKLSNMEVEKDSTRDIGMSSICQTDADRTKNIQSLLYKPVENSNFKTVHPRDVPISNISRVVDSNKTEFFQSKCIAEWVHNYVKIIETDNTKLSPNATR